MLVFGKKSSTILAMILGAALITSAHATAETAKAASGFHPPQTAQEKWLDAALQTANDMEPDLTPYMLGDAKAPASVKSFVADKFSPQFINLLQKREREEVQRNCGGKYRAGEICGTDYLPWACVQDTSNALEYRTTKDSIGNIVNTTIEMRIQGEPRPKATYTIYNHKITGVSCHF